MPYLVEGFHPARTPPRCLGWDAPACLASPPEPSPPGLGPLPSCAVLLEEENRLSQSSTNTNLSLVKASTLNRHEDDRRPHQPRRLFTERSQGSGRRTRRRRQRAWDSETRHAGPASRHHAAPVTQQTSSPLHSLSLSQHPPGAQVWPITARVVPIERQTDRPIRSQHGPDRQAA